MVNTGLGAQDQSVVVSVLGAPAEHHRKDKVHTGYGFGARGGCTNHTGPDVVITRVRSRCLAAAAIRRGFCRLTLAESSL